MNKEKFLDELRNRLSGLPQEDIEERIAFYEEMIDDRMEDGVSEEEAVSRIGSVENIARQIMSEIPLTKLVQEKVKPKRNLRAWEIVLLVLGSPLWISLLISVLAAIFSVYVAIWSVVLVVYAFDLTFAMGVLACIVGILIFLGEGNPGGALFSLGAGIVCAGLAILLFFVCIWITKAVVKLTGKILLGIKTLFVGKKD